MTEDTSQFYQQEGKTMKKNIVMTAAVLGACLLTASCVTMRVPAGESVPYRKYNNTWFIKKVIVGEGAEIDTEAFMSNFITGVTIGKGAEIGVRAFDFNLISSLTIGEGVTIGMQAFTNNALTSLTIPKGVTIERRAFTDNRISSLTIGEGVMIEYKAFEGNALTSLTIPKGVTIGEGAFANNQLSSLTLSEGVEEIGEEAFAGNKLTGIVLPNSLRTIGPRAFVGNQLTSVIIPDGVTDFAIDAFDGNNLAGPLVIPESVKTMRYWPRYSSDFHYAYELEYEVTGTGASRSLVCRYKTKYGWDESKLIIPDAVYGIPVTVLDFEELPLASKDEIVLPAGLTEIRYNTEADGFFLANKVTAPNDSVQALWDEFTVKQREKKIAWDAVVKEQEQKRKNEEAEELRRAAESFQYALDRIRGQ
jgi:predicted small secreted protein